MSHLYLAFDIVGLMCLNKITKRGSACPRNARLLRGKVCSPQKCGSLEQFAVAQAGITRLEIRINMECGMCPEPWPIVYFIEG